MGNIQELSYVNFRYSEVKLVGRSWLQNDYLVPLLDDLD
jgi:hypothetical protein